MKSTCPPKPEKILGPMESAHDLTGDIDLDGRVHRDHLRHLRDHEGVVREAHVADEHGGVVVHELVPTRHAKPPRARLFGSHHEARRRAAVSRGFFPSSPHATPTNSLVMAPDSIRSIMPSLNISL